MGGECPEGWTWDGSPWGWGRGGWGWAFLGLRAQGGRTKGKSEDQGRRAEELASPAGQAAKNEGDGLCRPVAVLLVVRFTAKDCGGWGPSSPFGLLSGKHRRQDAV
ncbi:hypothetical protein GCM10010428_74720 [Actinosynnema pretiosum subsp. pretiosum]